MSIKRSTRPLGQRGEKLAVNHLIQQGYIIMQTNWRCKHGELDIIARKDEMLVFVEVRTRHADSSEPAFESITPRKQLKLTTLAHAYLATHQLTNSIWRIDVIAIGVPRMGNPIIEHTEDALDW